MLRSLPDWFGIEAALVQYAKDAAVLPTLTARAGGPLCGFLSVKRHFPESAESGRSIASPCTRPTATAGSGARCWLLCEAWLVDEGVRLLPGQDAGSLAVE